MESVETKTREEFQEASFFNRSDKFNFEENWLKK